MEPTQADLKPAGEQSLELYRRHDVGKPHGDGQITSRQTQFDERDLALLRNTLTQDLTPPEFDLFVRVCKHTGLDPFHRQIHAIKRGGRLTIQTSIDGYRLIADRTGRYAPGRETTFTYDKNGDLLTATSYVKKLVAGAWHEVAATVFWKEYCPPPGQDHMWKRMPHVMLSKCAESAALRRAFPAELSGVYTEEEMEQATSEMAVVVAEEPEEPEPDYTALRTKAIKRLKAKPPTEFEEAAQILRDWSKDWPAEQKRFLSNDLDGQSAIYQKRTKMLRKMETEAAEAVAADTLDDVLDSWKPRLAELPEAWQDYAATRWNEACERAEAELDAMEIEAGA